MFTKIYLRLVQRFGTWRLAQISLVSLIALMLVLIGLEFLLPLPIDSLPVGDLVSVQTVGSTAITDSLDSVDGSVFANVFWPKLFKAATPLNDKPMADKTLQRIKSQLKLQCVMNIAGEPVAYIHVQGMGLKKCRTGEGVGDLFTTLDIGRNRVEIQVLEHRVTLHL